MNLKTALKGALSLVISVAVIVLFAAAVSAATIEDVEDNSLLVGRDVYELHTTNGYTFDNVLDSINYGGSSIFFKWNGLWFDLLENDFGSIADMTIDKATPLSVMRTRQYRKWYRAGDEVIFFDQVASTYEFGYSLPAQIVAGEEFTVPVTLATDEPGAAGYDKVRFAFRKSDGPGDVTFKATDSLGQEHTFINSGVWGPPGGFALPADYSATTDWTLAFNEAGEYTIEFELVDLSRDAVIALESVTVTVLARSTYDFSYTVDELIVAGEEASASVTLSTKDLGDIGYSSVRFTFEKIAGDGDITFTATDSQGRVHTFINSGVWGPADGFALPADYSATTDWTLNFAAAGSYTIEFKLLDLTTNAVLVSESVMVTAVNRSTYDFSYIVDQDPIVTGEDATARVTLATDQLGDVGYESVLFYFEKTAGSGDVTFKATDSSGQDHTFTNSGSWGPPGGFPLPAEYNRTTVWTLNFSSDGEYTIRFYLKDLKSGNTLAEESVSVEVLNRYAINVSANPENGGTAVAEGSFIHGTEVTVTAVPNESDGYRFVNWTEGDTVVSADSVYSFTATADRNLVANFALKQYNIMVSVSPEEGGTATGGGIYTHGDTVTLKATANPGYEFINWSVNGVVWEEEEYSFTATQDISLVANFRAIDWWSASATVSGVVSDFRVNPLDRPELQYFELYGELNGEMILISNREAVEGGFVRLPNAIFAAMNRIEVRFYRGSSDVAPCAVAACLGSVDPEADFSFGKLALTLQPTGSWLVELEDTGGINTAKFSLTVRDFESAAFFEVYADGNLAGGSALGGFVRSIPLVFSDPSLLAVKFYNAGGDLIGTAACLESGELVITIPNS